MLITQIKQQLPKHRITLTDEKHINSDVLEAFAFAWLAYAFDHDIYGNIPAVTGADKSVVLGTAFFS